MALNGLKNYLLHSLTHSWHSKPVSACGIPTCTRVCVCVCRVGGLFFSLLVRTQQAMMTVFEDDDDHHHHPHHPHHQPHDHDDEIPPDVTSDSTVRPPPSSLLTPSPSPPPPPPPHFGLPAHPQALNVDTPSLLLPLDSIDTHLQPSPVRCSLLMLIFMLTHNPTHKHLHHLSIFSRYSPDNLSPPNRCALSSIFLWGMCGVVWCGMV